MALIRWQPFAEMEALRRHMDQVFDELAGATGSTDKMWQPAVELQDTNDSLVLRAEVPGIEAKDLDVRVTREAVAIAGEHRYEQKAEEKGFFRSEFRYGKFQRLIPLPVAVQNDKVQADFTNGILTLTLPKVESVQNRVVKLNLGQEAISNQAMDGNQAQEAIEPSNQAMDGNQAQEDNANQPAAV